MQQAGVPNAVPAAIAAAASHAGARPNVPQPVVRQLGCVEYEPTWRAMLSFTRQRPSDAADELWVLEHPPVYTLGVGCGLEYLPGVDNGIPAMRSDRGGKVTYHGPGQVVIYLLLDMRRRGLTVRPLVRLMEQAVVDLLGGYGIAAEGRVEAPGVYVRNPNATSWSGEPAKIAALGLRIRNGCCYHGLAFNARMDLAPFRAIDPCGYAGLAVTQAHDLGITDDPALIGSKLVGHVLRRLA